ncbi:MAG TPA: hypothetical protein VEB40_15995 [Flavipsychrobacter sp.]|nr:hypothetical protein [Flavipsychrobacter sp.]
MNKNLRNAGLILLAAGALAYPAYKLYQYLANRRNEQGEGEEEHPMKNFIPSLRGNRHKRKMEDGHMAH